MTKQHTEATRDDVLNAIAHNNLDTLHEYKTKGFDMNSVTFFMSAVWHGYIDIVKFFIENGANTHIDAKNHDQETPLMIAIKKGHTAVTSLLINQNANLNLQNSEHQTALILATIQNNEDIVKLLLEKGAAIDNPNKKNALHYAAELGYQSIATLLINEQEKTYHSTLNERDAYNYTALMHAARNGNKDIVELLISHGVDITPKVEYVSYQRFAKPAELFRWLFDKNIFVPIGSMALILAIEGGHSDTAQLLIEKGANPYGYKEISGKIPFFRTQGAAKMAIDKGNIDFLRFLINDYPAIGFKQKHKRDFDQNNQQDREEIKEFLPDLYDLLFYTYETMSCRSNVKLEIFKLLIDKGVDINKPYNYYLFKEYDQFARCDRYFTEEISFAKKYIPDGDQDIPLIKMLIQKGAVFSEKSFTHARDKIQNTNITKLLTPLQEAASLGYEETVTLNLQKEKVSTNDANNYGLALVLAIKNNQLNIAKIILENKNTNIFITDANGLDPLMAATYFNCQDLIEMMLQRYQTTKEKMPVNNWGSSPLVVAAFQGNDDLVFKFIDSQLFDINEKNIFGTTPLIAAIYSGKTTTIEKILSDKNIKKDINVLELLLIGIACSYAIVVHQNFSIPFLLIAQLRSGRAQIETTDHDQRVRHVEPADSLEEHDVGGNTPPENQSTILFSTPTLEKKCDSQEIKPNQDKKSHHGH